MIIILRKNDVLTPDNEADAQLVIKAEKDGTLTVLKNRTGPTGTVSILGVMAEITAALSEGGAL